MCFLPGCPEDFRESCKANMGSFHLKVGSKIKWPLRSCVADMDFSKSIYRNISCVIFPILTTAAEWGNTSATRQKSLPQMNE